MKGTVVLLHGLTRTDQSMRRMAEALSSDGYRVLNVGYPSRHHAVEPLADHVATLLQERLPEGAEPHFVTHSLGGILVRHMRASGKLNRLGRVVMLGPPNQGSEVVDKLHWLPPFRWINGPAGNELGTGPLSVPNTLGPVDFELGVIAGNRTINFFLSLLIPGSDDGKVAVRRTRIEGMNDFITVHATHPFMMNNREVIQQTLHFLNNGRFDRDSPEAQRQQD